MGLKFTMYTNESPKTTFKTSFILNGLFGIFAFVGLLLTHYYSAERTKAKWLGGICGLVPHYIIIGITYLCGAVADATTLAMIIFFGWVLFLIFFGVYYGKEQPQSSALSKEDISTILSLTRNALSEQYTNIAVQLFRESGGLEPSSEDIKKIESDILQYLISQDHNSTDIYFRGTDVYKFMLSKIGTRCLSIGLYVLFGVSSLGLERELALKASDAVIEEEKHHEVSLFERPTFFEVRQAFLSEISKKSKNDFYC